MYVVGFCALDCAYGIPYVVGVSASGGHVLLQHFNFVLCRAHASCTLPRSQVRKASQAGLESSWSFVIGGHLPRHVSPSSS